MKIGIPAAKIHLSMLVAVVLLAAEPLHAANAPTHPYVGEMPSVDRVLQAMTVPDARETAIRQLYAFAQLCEIIHSMAQAERRWHREGKPTSNPIIDYTAEEQRLMDAYSKATQDVWDAAQKKLKTDVDKQKFQTRWESFEKNTTDPRFGTVYKGLWPIEGSDDWGLDLFKLLFTPDFHARFRQVMVEWDARARGNFNAQVVAAPTVPFTPAPAAGAKPTEAPNPSSDQLVNTLAAAVTGMFGNGNSAPAKKDIPVGLRMIGDYANGDGLHMTFTAESAVVTLNNNYPYPQTDDYYVELKGTAVAVTIQHGMTPFRLVLKPDGTLLEYGVTGKPAQAAPTGKGGLAGLRLNGTYEGGEDQMHIAFTTESAAMTSGQLSHGSEYGVELKGGAVVVTVQDGSKPLTLVFKDGALHGSGKFGVLSPAGAHSEDRVAF